MLRLAVQAIATAIILFPGNAIAQDSLPQRDDVLRFVAAYVEATNTGDMTDYVDMYVHDADLVTVDDGEFRRGWEVIRDEANAAAGLQGAYRVSTGVVEVVTLGADVALAVFPFVINIATQEGVQQQRGAISMILKRTGGRYRIVHEHTSRVGT